VTTARTAVVVLVALAVRRATYSPPATGGTGFSIRLHYWVLVALLGRLEAGLLLGSLWVDGSAPARRLYAVGAGGGPLALALGLVSGAVILLDPASGSVLELLQSTTAVLTLSAALVGMTGALLGGLLEIGHAIDTRVS
jgi:hypothetical protein